MTDSTLTPCPDNHPYAPLLEATHWDQLQERALTAARALGAGDFVLRLSAKHARDGNKVLSSLAPAPLEAFVQRQGVDDPVERHFATSSLPLAWSVDAQDGAGGGGALTILHRSNAITFRVDFLGNRSFADPAFQGTFVLLSFYLHAAADNIWQRQQSVAKVQLSTREIECLSWSAMGKTSREVGLILGISRRTVYFHLMNVSAKLEVYTTRHAISRAMSLGLLH